MPRFAYRVLAVLALLSAFTMAFLLGTESGSAEPIPTCYPIQLAVGSHVYADKACNERGAVWFTPPPAGHEFRLTIDGGMSSGSIIIAGQFPTRVASHDGHAVASGTARP